MRDIYFVDLLIIIFLLFLNIFGYISMETSGNPDMNFGVFIFSAFFILIYVFAKSIICLIFVKKRYTLKEIDIKRNVIIKTVPYILIFISCLILFIYKTIYYDFFFVLRMITLPIVFIGNLLWFYYWSYVEKNRMFKVFLNFYNGLYMLLIILYCDPHIYWIYYILT